MILECSFDQLMEKIRCNREEDVSEGEILPVRMEDRLDSGLATGARVRARPVIEGGQSVQHFPNVAKGARGIHCAAEVIARHRALGTFTILASSGQELLRVVADVHSKNRMSTTYNAVAASDGDAVDAGLDEWLEDHGHACVEEVRVNSAARSLTGDMLETCGGKICEEDLPTTCRLAAHILR